MPWETMTRYQCHVPCAGLNLQILSDDQGHYSELAMEGPRAEALRSSRLPDGFKQTPGRPAVLSKRHNITQTLLTHYLRTALDTFS